MRRNIVGLIALASLATLTVVSQADALTGLKAYKEVVINIQITPSPAPVGWYAPNKSYPDPFPPAAQVASSGTTSDVPFAADPVMIAQANAQPTPTVPVQFVAKPDPNAAYLRVIPHPPGSGQYTVPYGTTIVPCAFEIFTYYTNSYNLMDWGYNTTKTGGANSGTYPIQNYPTISSLSWAVPDFSALYTPYWNQGPGGEKTWAGAVNQSQQHCINLTINVPNAQPAGVYTATVQYSLYVTLP
ncbi:MAG: hypothetical protein QOJ39_2684 [Candidatus Eremiobacteraeota bacterium]|jgi:hypothetical protein|nr:hypothetical protein [Candidatus Eremiobacteraeota bacterium]